MFRECCGGRSVACHVKGRSPPVTNTQDVDEPAAEAPAAEDEPEMALLASLVDERVE